MTISRWMRLCRLNAVPALFCFALAFAVTATAQIEIYDSGGELTPEQASYDVRYYDLSLRVSPADSSIGGSLTLVADMVAPTRWLVMDLDTLLRVSSVVAGAPGAGSERGFERRGGRLWIDLQRMYQPGEMTVLTVSYAGRPRIAPRPPWDGGFTWSRTPGGAPWIATSNQGQGADVWWPVKDHVSDKPDSMSIRIRVPEPLVVASNGRLRRVEPHGDGTRTYHWFVSTPISTYNVALNIAPYRLIEEQFVSVAGDTFPVQFYVLPEHHERGRELFPEILDHLRFFEELLGPYPFRTDKYGVAQTPHLGMEHQTIIAYGAGFDNRAMTGIDWGFDALHHHELAHEWWGNLVTNPDWNDMWLHEGFGTYMQALYAERLHGAEGLHAYMESMRGGIENQRPVAPRESQTAGEIYFNTGGDIYYKGAWALHTLRYLVGDDAFFTALRRMAYPDPTLERVTDGSHVRFSTTDDFLRIVEATSGMTLDWFFEVYLRQPHLPRLVTEAVSGGVELRWEPPTRHDFPMPVEVEIDGRRQRVPMPDGRARLSTSGTARVVVDPDGWILRAP